MTDDLLVKYLLGEVSPQEQHQVKSWVEASVGNRKYLESLERVWQQSHQLAMESKVDADAAWLRFKSRVAVKNNEDKKPVKRLLSPFMRMAATVMLILALSISGWWWMNQSGHPKELAFQSFEEVSNNVLPDGSAVALNKNSEIIYPSKFKGGVRKVKLKGEAFFDVKRDTERPFMIDAGPVTITVLGTSFNVRNTGTEVEVIVETGRVKVQYGEKTIVLEAGEKTVVSSDHQELSKEEQKDQLHNYYRSRVFVCDNTPLWRLVEILKEAYDVEIVFGRDALRDLQWDITLNNESLDAILQLMSETFDIKVKKQDNKIILQ